MAGLLTSNIPMLPNRGAIRPWTPESDGRKWKAAEVIANQETIEKAKAKRARKAARQS